MFADVSPYPDSALSTGKLMAIAFVTVAVLAIWLISVYIAAREPKHPGIQGGRPAGPHPGDTQAARRRSAGDEPAGAAGARTDNERTAA